MNKTDNILFKGISYSVNSKREFIKKALHLPHAQEEIIKIIKRPDVLRKLHTKDYLDGRAMLTDVQIYDEDLDIIFDEMLGKKINNPDVINNFDEEKREIAEEYLKSLSMNGEKVEFDIIYLVTFGICHQDRCQDMLEELWNTHPEYYAYFKDKLSVNRLFESAMDVRKVPYARMVYAMIMKMREEQSEELFDEIMKLINVGYRHLKSDLKGRQNLDFTAIKCTISETLDLDRLHLSTISEVPVLMIMAEAKGLDIIYDFESYGFFERIKIYEENLGAGYEKDLKKEYKRPDEVKAFIDGFEDKFNTFDSMTELYTKSENDSFAQGDLFSLIFHKYNIGIRKFSLFYLDDEEVNFILNNTDKPQNKKYWYALHVAVLCKYIRAMEDSYIELREKTSLADDYSYNEKKESLKRIADDIEKKKKSQEQTEKKQNENIIKLEKELKAERERHESDIKAFEAEREELKALRNYVYALNEENVIDEDYKAEEASIDKWNKKRVIVFGGHENWQKKVKKYFPDWTFILADNRSFPSNKMKDKDYVICNTEVLSHALYYKIISSCDKSQKLLYVRSNNIDLLIQELDAQDR